MISKNNTVLKISLCTDKKTVKVQIETEKEFENCKFEIKDNENKTVKTGFVTENVFGFEIENAKTWSIEKPNLYTFAAVINYKDGKSEEISDKFGFRWFLSDEKHLYLNGYPFYMRAYIRGAAAHEHQNNCNLSEYDFYKKNILTAKSYGFNTIRFHSVVPPEECFRAADELGILIHIEMRRENLEYDNLTEMLCGKNDFVSDEELEKIINTLYNHPSFMVYCVGNEIRKPGINERIKEIREYIKKKDPTRLFIDTCAHGEYDREGVDFDVQHMGYYFPYGKHADMFYNTDNLLCFGNVSGKKMVSENENGDVIRRGIAFPRPVIAHEVCHYTSWRDYYALKEKFIKYKRPVPWWVDEEIKMLEAKGYKENFKETLQITKDFQFRCWKTALENLRASTFLSGFHMLQFADTDRYENSNGIVDCFDDPHGISAEEFCKFNGDTVVLARLPKQIYTAGESVKIPVVLSQYKINPPKTAQFKYAIKGKTVVSSGTLEGVETGKSGNYEICSLNIKLPQIEKAEKYILECCLDFDDNTKCKNSWELWSFPKTDECIDAKLDMEAEYLSDFRENLNSELTVTDKLNDDLFEKLENGEDVMLIYRTDWTRHLLHKDMEAPEYAFKAVWERFKGVIWDRGTINGGADDKEILNKLGFVTDGQINYQYYPLIEDSDKINLDDVPVKVHSIVSGLDKSSRDRFDPKKFELPELMYDRTMRNFTYAFDLKVGKGRLLVTGFNFTGAKEKEIATIAMLKTLVNYCHTEDFGSGNEISVEAFKNYLMTVAEEGPNKERMMTQYWQLDNEPVESPEYWQESERYLRE